MPDVTRAQIVALVQAIIAVLVAFGAPITETQSVALLGLAAVLGAVLMRGDAGIRQARNHRVAIEAATGGIEPAGDEVDPERSVEDGATVEHADAKAER